MKQQNATEIEHYLNSTEAQQKLYKRSLIVVIMSQIFGGAGLAAGITVGALLAKDMLGTASLQDFRLHYLHLVQRLLLF